VPGRAVRSAAELAELAARVFARLDERELSTSFVRICAERHASRDEVLSGRLFKTAAVARHRFWEHCRAVGLSNVEIARLFECDHASVRAALEPLSTEKDIAE
jgi:hypothetical protein